MASPPQVSDLIKQSHSEIPSASHHRSSTEPMQEGVVETMLHPESFVAAVVEDSVKGSVESSAATVEGAATVVVDVSTEFIPSKKSLSPSPPSLGAWATPLKISLPSIPAASSVLREVNSSILQELSSPSHWPSLSAGQQAPSSRQLQRECQNRARQVTNKVNVKAPFAPKLPVEEIYVPEVKEDGNLRFPWAAKMDPSMRNLYRTSTPTYLEDGTPKVTIPSHILLHGPENQKEYIIGQFYRCSIPAGGLVNAVVNRIWGRSCKIFSRKLGETSYLFHIPDSSTRSWVLQRGMWHVDDCLMFVAPWSPAATLSPPEISTIPVWVTLKNIPHQLYSIPGISRIASGLGEPMLTNKPRLDPTLMGEAKIMVEVELDKQFPQRIALDDKKGTITMVDVEYSWIPSKCVRCGHLGHKESRCLQQVPHSQVIIPSSNDGVVSATVSNTKVNFPAYAAVPNLVVATDSTVPTVFAAPVTEHVQIPTTPTTISLVEAASIHVPFTTGSATDSAISTITTTPLEVDQTTTTTVSVTEAVPSDSTMSDNVITEFAPINPVIATTYVAPLATEDIFITPSSQPGSSQLNVVGGVISNPYDALNSGVLALNLSGK